MRAMEASKPEEGRRMRNLTSEIVLTILLAALIFAGVQVTLQSFRVEGISMEPTINDGQYILANKAVYFFRPPRRGEVIVFQLSSGPHTDYIKRVIALPGETVWAQEGKVHIKDAEGKEYILEEPYLEGEKNFSFDPYLVRPGHYFVLGDNREHSSDSRKWGDISGENIIGKAWLYYWPPSEWGRVKSYSPAY